jgi:hypothetical protein
MQVAVSEKIKNKTKKEKKKTKKCPLSVLA